LAVGPEGGIQMTITRVFRSGNSQAVRLPKEFSRIPDLRVENWVN
jgi:antitoxin component of MazEF toxin-antitoxin module